MRRKKPKKIISFIYKAVVVIMLYTIFALAIESYEQYLMPVIISMSKMHTKSLVNMSIDEVIGDIVEKNNITSKNFYNIERTNSGSITSVEVNTILINELCKIISSHSTKVLENHSDTVIYVPSSPFFEIVDTSIINPKIPINLVPMNHVIVDYETSFTEAGINQTLFEIWIDFTVVVKIINPFQDPTIEVTRRIPLVSTLINGEVPLSYWNK